MSHTQDLVFRSATLDDTGAITALFNACASARGEPQTKIQNIRNALQMPGLDLETDILLAVGPGELAGLALVQHNPPNTMIFALTDVHPRYKGQGVGKVLCEWAEERARRSIPELPPEARVTLLQKQLSSDVVACELLLWLGYQVVRYNFSMVIEFTAPPPPPTIPAGIVVRPFIREQEGRDLTRALQQAFRDNWGYVERPFELEYERWMHILDSALDSDTPEYWFVALDGREIAVFVLNQLQVGENPMHAGIYVVGVRPDWRRRGIALALLQHSFVKLYQRGKRQVGLDVDAQNPTGATRLYEKAGMRVERRYDFFEKELRPGAN